MNIRCLITTQLHALFVDRKSLSSTVVTVSPEKKPYFQMACYGVARYYVQLNFLVDQLLAKPIKKKEIDIKILLLIGLYELYFLRTPDHVVVSEAVETVRAMQKPWAAGLVNAVLRRALREKEMLIESLKSREDIFYAHPQWMVEKIKRVYPNEWQRILDANNEQAPMTLRVNVRKNSRTEYLNQLAEAGIAAVPTIYSADGIRLEKPCAVSLLPGFAEGAVSVQDESPQLVVDLLDLQTGMRVLDACAAPGGKTAHMLERCADLRELVAIDVDKKRLLRIEENLSRLHLQATVCCVDVLEFSDGKFDRILLDAPCSATGVIRRHPDIKFLRQPDDIASLAATQLAMLCALWPSLKQGGCLVYATCSILPEENEQVIAAFLSEHPDAKELPIDVAWGVRQTYGRQVLPGDHQADGFYYCIVIKT